MVVTLKLLILALLKKEKLCSVLLFIFPLRKKGLSAKFDVQLVCRVIFFRSRIFLKLLHFISILLFTL